MHLDLTSIKGVYNKIEGSLDHFECDQKHLQNICFSIRSHIGYIWLKDLLVIDSKQSEYFDLRYFFYSLENNKLFFLSFRILKSSSMPSITHLWGNASALEREANELFGVQFERKYKNDLFAEENQNYPMLKDEWKIPKCKIRNQEESRHTINLEQPLLRHQLQFEVAIMENYVSKCEVSSGLFHIGLERMAHESSLQELMIFNESYFGLKGASLNFLLCYGIEKEKKIDIPDRARAMRMVILEFSRVVEHLRCLREVCFQLRAEALYNQLSLLAKQIQSLFISYCGHENLSHAIRPGGVFCNVDQTWLSRVMSELEDIQKSLELEVLSLEQSSNWRGALNFSIASKELVQEYSLSGPVARAAGVNLDYRKLRQLYFYSDVTFEVPLGARGDAFDLFLIRMTEIIQSFQIITQVLDNLPAGSIVSEDFLDFKNAKWNLSAENEENYVEGVNSIFQVGDIKTSEFFESSNGLLGVHFSCKDSLVKDLKYFSSDFYLKNSFESFVRGSELDRLALSWLLIGSDMKMVER